MSESLAGRIMILETSEDETEVTVYIKKVKRLREKSLSEVLKQLLNAKNMTKLMKNFETKS